jgi:DNA-binding response OmpR family regulator
MPAGSVLLVEDEEAIADPFAELLRMEGYDAVVVGTAAEARAETARRSFDAVFLDVMLPDGDGRDICRELRHDSDVPIIMLTARGAVTDRIVGLELGADDYIVKPFEAAEAVSRLRAVMRRSRRDQAPSPVAVTTAAARPSSRALAFGDLVIDVEAHRVTLRDQAITLSRKEFHLLATLATRAGHVVTREELMSTVWDENWFGPTRTLDVHIGCLRRKLGDQEPWRLIHTVRGVGFRFEADAGHSA